MWKKVTTKSQLQDIKIGTELKMYPIDGHPLPNFDSATSENSALRIVSKNDNEILEIDFVSSEQKINYDLIIGLNKIVFSPIKKTYTGVIESGRYWINE